MAPAPSDQPGRPGSPAFISQILLKFEDMEGPEILLRNKLRSKGSVCTKYCDGPSTQLLDILFLHQRMLLSTKVSVVVSSLLNRVISWKTY